MQKHHQILIVGGGNAGISLAAQLLRKRRGLDIAIIEPSDKHYYQPAWTLVGGGAYDIQDTVRNEAEFIPKGVTWIKDKAVSFDPERSTVVTEKNGPLTYDYLVVAPGIQLDWHKIKGSQETLGKNSVASNYTFETAPYTWESAQQIKPGDKLIFTAPNTPIKCGGAPMKIMFLLSDYLRRKGLLDKVEVHYYSGGSVIFGVEPYAKTLRQVAKRYGVKEHYKHNLVEIDGARKVAYFEDDKGNRIEQPFDFMHVVPPQSAPDFIKQSPLAVPDNPLGWVDVDKDSMQHKRYPNVFALGDASSLPTSKTGAAIRKQVPVLVQNLLSLIDKKPIPGAYDGYSACPIVTGYGKLILAEFDYQLTPKETFPFDQSKERWTMYQLKRHILPWMYWNRILRGTA